MRNDREPDLANWLTESAGVVCRLNLPLQPLLGETDFPSSADHSSLSEFGLVIVLESSVSVPPHFKLFAVASAIMTLGLSIIGHVGSVVGFRFFPSLVARG